MSKPMLGAARCRLHSASRWNTHRLTSLSASTPCGEAALIFCCTPMKSPGNRKFRICRRPSLSVLKRNAQPENKVNSGVSACPS